MLDLGIDTYRREAVAVDTRDGFAKRVGFLKDAVTSGLRLLRLQEKERLPILSIATEGRLRLRLRHPVFGTGAEDAPSLFSSKFIFDMFWCEQNLRRLDLHVWPSASETSDANSAVE